MVSNLERKREDGVRYRQSPHGRALRQAYAKRYRQRPEVRAKSRAYEKTPAEMERRRKKAQKHYHKPHVKARYKTPEFKVKQKAYYATPQGRASRERMRLKRQADGKYMITNRVNGRLRKSLLIKKDGRSKYDLLQCSRQQLLDHIESQFVEGMSWSNFGEWEIDHIVPVAWFDYRSIDDEDCRRCWSLANLQPLNPAANRSKRDRFADIDGIFYSQEGWIAAGRPMPTFIGDLR